MSPVTSSRQRGLRLNSYTVRVIHSYLLTYRPCVTATTTTTTTSSFLIAEDWRPETPTHASLHGVITTRTIKSCLTRYSVGSMIITNRGRDVYSPPLAEANHPLYFPFPSPPTFLFPFPFPPLPVRLPHSSTSCFLPFYCGYGSGGALKPGSKEAV